MAAKHLIWGLVLLVLGLQLRAVETFVLTPQASQFVAHKMSQGSFLSTEDPMALYVQPYENLLSTVGPVPQKRITPPRWLGWAMISVGAVLVLQGLTTKQ